MFRYEAFGLSILSEWPLEYLPETMIEGNGDVRLRSLDLSEVRCDWGVDGAERTYLARPREALLHWPGVGTFWIRSGREITVDRVAGIPDYVVNLFTMGAALGVLLHQRGMLVLHGSAVAKDAAAVAFVGFKGSGKSTTAGAFVEREYRLISDDLLCLRETDPPVLFPGVPVLKLWEDAVSELQGSSRPTRTLHGTVPKHLCDLSEDRVRRPVRLGLICVLDAGKELTIEPLNGREAFYHLLQQSYAPRFVGTQGTASSLFGRVAELTKSLAVVRLRRPRDLARLPDVVALVERWADGNLVRPTARVK